MHPSFFDEMHKIAADEKKRPVKDIAKIVGSGLLGFGAGTAGGLLAGEGANYLSKKMFKTELPRSALHIAAPLVGAAGGIAYSIYKAKELEAIQRALKDSSDSRSG